MKPSDKIKCPECGGSHTVGVGGFHAPDCKWDRLLPFSGGTEAQCARRRKLDTMALRGLLGGGVLAAFVKEETDG